MEFPNFDINKPISLILFCAFLVSTIIISIRDNSVSEYLYFYLCNISLLLVILSVILFTSFVLRVYTNSIPRTFLIFTSIYTILMVIYWYLGFSLLFEDAIPYLLITCLFFISSAFITFAMIEFGIALSTYHGDSSFILHLKEIHHSITDNGSPERYRSLTDWNLEEEEIYVLKFILSSLILIFLSVSVLYLPSMLSSVSPRLYDVYAIDGNVKADMKDEYSAGRNFYIPVEVGGLNTCLFVTLSKFEYDYGRFKEISSLILKPNESMIQENHILSGETSSSGKYMIIVNTTSITPGDYELEFKNTQNTSLSKVFALIPE